MEGKEVMSPSPLNEANFRRTEFNKTSFARCKITQKVLQIYITLISFQNTLKKSLLVKHPPSLWHNNIVYLVAKV